MVSISRRSIRSNPRYMVRLHARSYIINRTHQSNLLGHKLVLEIMVIIYIIGAAIIIVLAVAITATIHSFKNFDYNNEPFDITK